MRFIHFFFVQYSGPHLLELTVVSTFTNEPGHNISYKIACAPSENSDQHVHLVFYGDFVDPNQTPCSATSDLCMHCLSITLLGVSRLKWVKFRRCRDWYGFMRLETETFLSEKKKQ